MEEVLEALAAMEAAREATDRTTVAPPPGTCSGRFGGGGGWGAARLLAARLQRKVQEWANDKCRRSHALSERRLTKKLLEP